MDENGNEEGTVYVDVDEREHKVVGDCHFTVRCSKEVSIDPRVSETTVTLISAGRGRLADSHRRSLPLPLLDDV